VSSKPTIAFVTYSGVPDLSADDRLAVDALATIGIQTEAVSWDDAPGCGTGRRCCAETSTSAI
jgi:hypothetical protein